MARALVAALVAALALVCLGGVQCSTPAHKHYVAAVVDYAAPIATALSPEENMLTNILVLADFVQEASQQGADILVFAEDGLQGYGNLPFPMDVPAPEDHFTACTNERAATPLRKLSCLASDHSIYLAVNLVHQVPCNQVSDAKCPTRAYYNYNTNVVFDRNGKIVARYHKYNLFGERNNNVPPSVEYSIFDTDFGVRFGMFICFDILFDKPSAELARRLNVTDFVYSAAWFSEVPFLTSVQAHSGWAHALDVTVLASGMNYPKGGSSGSGIYRGRQGILNSTINWRHESTLLISRVPKFGYWGSEVPDPDLDRFNPVRNYLGGKDPYEDVKNLTMIWDKMGPYTTRLLPRPELGQTIEAKDTIYNNGLSCNFRVQMHGVSMYQMSSAAVSMHGSYSRRREAPAHDFDKTEAEDAFDGFYYRTAAFSGVRDHSGVATTGVQVCALMSCLSKELESCGWIAPGLGMPNIKWTEFQSVHIDAEFESSGTLQFPSTQAGPRYEPLPSSVYTFKNETLSDSKQKVSLSLDKTPFIDLRTFAIYGRYFAWDGLPPTS